MTNIIYEECWADFEKNIFFMTKQSLGNAALKGQKT